MSDVQAPASQTTTSRPSGEILGATGLSFSYSKKSVLHDLSLEIAAGATGLLGPNGAGKTTLIQLFLGLLRPATGSLRWFGESGVRIGPELRQDIGYMPETDALLPHLTGVEMVAHLARIAGLPTREAISRAHEVLHYVGLGEARYRDVGSYSTGMRQRVKLAQALAHGPRLVILDEPTNGLDPHGREEMLALIRDLWQNKGLSVLLCSHLLHDVEETCSSVIVLKEGRVVQQRKLEMVEPSGKQAPASAFLLRVRENPAELVLWLEQHGSLAKVRRDQAIVAQLPPEQTTRFFFQAAVETGLQLREITPLRETLEDIFVQALGS